MEPSGFDGSSLEEIAHEVFLNGGHFTSTFLVNSAGSVIFFGSQNAHDSCCGVLDVPEAVTTSFPDI